MTGLTSLSPLSIVSTMGKQPVTWEGYCAEYWSKELQKNMDRCTGRDAIPEIIRSHTFGVSTCVVPRMQNRERLV